MCGLLSNDRKKSDGYVHEADLEVSPACRRLKEHDTGTVQWARNLATRLTLGSTLPRGMLGPVRLAIPQRFSKCKRIWRQGSHKRRRGSMD
jgi:hypothetical protein